MLVTFYRLITVNVLILKSLTSNTLALSSGILSFECDSNASVIC